MEKKIYLAGGKGEWRNLFIRGWKIVDPHAKDESIMKICDYVVWDLFAIDQCDAVLAFMEDDNPSGIGMATEVGYAKAKGKMVIYVDRLLDERKYFGFVAHTADLMFQHISEAVHFLEAMTHE